MSKELIVALIILAGVVWGEVQSCNSCGSECQKACGTRHFRTCCFNYMKKRSGGASGSDFSLNANGIDDDDSNLLPLAMDPSLRLELWLAKSRLPYFHHNTNGYLSEAAAAAAAENLIDNYGETGPKNSPPRTNNDHLK